MRYATEQMSDEFERQDITGTLLEQIRQAETFVVNNRFATSDPLDIPFSCHFSGSGTLGNNTMYFSFVATAPTVTIRTCDTGPENPNTPEPASDTLIAIYDRLLQQRPAA